MNDDLINVQIQLAHQEHMIQELSHMIYTQQKQMDRLSKEFQVLKEQMLLGGEAEPKSMAHVPPPHY